MKYDTLYINGKIFTSDEENLYAEAMAVKDGRIAWVGLDKDAASLAGEARETFDLCGKRVLPGFVDCHMHAIMLSDFAKQISVLPPEIYSIEDLIMSIRKVRSRQDAGQWIKGWGYDEGKLAENRAPNRHDLDAGCSDSPVVVQRSCTHIWSVNSRALEIAGITKNTPDPEGGKIGRFENGEPDGILYETATVLIQKVMPVKTADDMADDMANLSSVLLSQGVTTISDMMEGSAINYDHIYSKAIERGFKNRVSCYYLWRVVEEMGEELVSRSPYLNGTGQIRISGIKLIGDGSVSGRTAWCDRPYLTPPGKDPEYGMPVCSEEELLAAKEFCRKHKCQLSIHCMGARAIDRAIDMTWQEKPWMEDAQIPHVRLEHVTMPGEKAIKRSAESGIAWATQPIFLYSEIESYRKNLQAERIEEIYNISDWLNAGIIVAFSTDAPATSWAAPSDPFTNLKGAVTRKAWNGQDCGQRHKVDIETAIKLYTREAAPVAGFSDTGMLRKGFAADFIVLDRDILSIPSDDIDQVKVDLTWIGGNLVYSRN